MTDKEIIIDGVDVSKCEYLQYKGCNFPQCLVKIASFDLKCEGYNCYLKRLVQKEQECETLKDENFAFEELIKTQEELIGKYKQALDKIEELIPKFDTSTECDYGDFDCENCSSLDEEIVCGYKLKKIILGIINKTKEKQ